MDEIGQEPFTRARYQISPHRLADSQLQNLDGFTFHFGALSNYFGTKLRHNLTRIGNDYAHACMYIFSSVSISTFQTLSLEHYSAMDSTTFLTTIWCAYMVGDFSAYVCEATDKLVRTKQ